MTDATANGLERSQVPAVDPLERYIGSTIREMRQKLGLTIAEISEQTGISRGMLSKIENAQTATSLETLTKIARALGISLSAFFRNYDVPTGSAQHVKNGEGMEVVRRGTKRGIASRDLHALRYCPINQTSNGRVNIVEMTELSKPNWTQDSK